MKSVRMLLILVFILVTGIGTATADSQGESYAFIPLDSQIHSSTSHALDQARQGYSRLAHLLLVAQSRGDVIAFEPEFSAGFVKVQYRSGFDIASWVGMSIYPEIHSAIAATSIQELGNNETYTTAAIPSFTIELFGSCFSGSKLGANRHIIASLRDNNNLIVSNYDGDADGSGNIEDCFDWSGPVSDFLPGYRVKFQRLSGSTLLSSHTTEIPWIKFLSAKKSTSAVTGKGPGGKSFTAVWEHPALDVPGNYLTVTKTGNVSVYGDWSVDFGTTAMRGDDYIEFKVKQTANIYIYRSFWLPSVYCGLGDNWCDLYGFPLKDASLSITHSSKTYTFQGKFDNWGWFGVDLVTFSKLPIFMIAGDTVSGTGISSPHQLPNLTAIPHPNADTVTGKAPPSRNFWVWIEIANSGNWYSRWSHTNSLGNYMADFSTSVDILPNQPVTAEVFYKDPTTGYVTVYLFSTGP